jgi:hypothetical protein
MKARANYSELIPELDGWNNGVGIDIDSWIGCVGNYEHFIGYGHLLWPDFIEHDDCVFFAHRFTEDNYRAFMQQTKGDKRAVECVMNHKHILDIFCGADPKPNREIVLYTGRLLKEIWQAKLNRDFPEREITVSFPEDNQDDLLDYEVSFFQER